MRPMRPRPRRIGNSIHEKPNSFGRTTGTTKSLAAQPPRVRATAPAPSRSPGRRTRKSRRTRKTSCRRRFRRSAWFMIGSWRTTERLPFQRATCSRLCMCYFKFQRQASQSCESVLRVSITYTLFGRFSDVSLFNDVQSRTNTTTNPNSKIENCKFQDFTWDDLAKFLDFSMHVHIELFHSKE